MATILCVDEEPSVAALLEHALTDLGHTPILASSVAEAMRIVSQETLDLAIADYRLTDGSGLDLLDQLRERGSDVPVIIMTSYTSVEHAVASMRRGAIDYLTKPLRAEALRLAVNNAVEVTRLRRENSDFRLEISSLRGSRPIVGSGPALIKVLETIATVAPTRATVLLEGESGTGKELFARALHEESPRRAEPFITVNCAALPEGLVESTLFGHERGAFTGASARQQGAFERAHRGTLLLDEISEMRLDLQAKLLRAIQEQEFERVGGHQAAQADVRIVATTNRDLKAEVDAGRFRRDLYYRLHVVPIRTPALREHSEDIAELTEYFVRAAARELGCKPPEILPETVAYLESRTWPGNVRELANAAERAVILCRDGRLTPASFGAEAAGGPRKPQLGSVEGGAAGEAPLPSLNLRELERVAIERALQATGGHRVRAAHLLGISERTLRNKLNGPHEPATLTVVG